jgi:hypothetical protein
MLILPKHSIDKKNIILPVLSNACTILKSDNFKNTIFLNVIFKIVIIEIALQTPLVYQPVWSGTHARITVISVFNPLRRTAPTPNGHPKSGC